ncbi:hypothetical protein QIT50_gp03 [Pyrobaculum spherical virus 2]|uniref:Uncharacterized protein n=1 Tax=Pyrobaculum spherical virus 2 TaxID=2730632 RepID=A0A6M3VZB8_9VIRU|nr:hypothetical protein QIT50_gp03 [Pyrobaculum spherical virus 2]QJF12415.1 hypothetical protein PSV2_gp03 [Pyrobaculum spherical virus 2]
MSQRLIFFLSAFSIVYFTLFSGNLYLDLVMWFMVVISTIYAAEISMALSNARLWYNVLVVSMAMSLPQTLFAIKLASSGKYLASWIDTLGSTLVDAMLVTAVLRRYVIGSPMIWNMVPFLIMWSMAALYVNYHAYAITYGLFRLPEWVIVVIGILLPMVLVRPTGLPRKSELIMLLLHAVSTGVSSYQLSNVIAQLPIHEIQLGIVATILATLPDFLVALIIRSAVAKILNEVASEEEALATMLASAVHDQILIPALVLTLYPEVAAYYPHYFNVIIILLKFTLLFRNVYWLFGVPFTIFLLLMPPV